MYNSHVKNWVNDDDDLGKDSTIVKVDLKMFLMCQVWSHGSIHGSEWGAQLQDQRFSCVLSTGSYYYCVIQKHPLP